MVERAVNLNERAKVFPLLLDGPLPLRATFDGGDSGRIRLPPSIGRRDGLGAGLLGLDPLGDPMLRIWLVHANDVLTVSFGPLSLFASVRARYQDTALKLGLPDGVSTGVLMP